MRARLAWAALSLGLFAFAYWCGQTDFLPKWLGGVADGALAMASGMIMGRRAMFPNGR